MRISEELRVRDVLMASSTLGVSNISPIVADDTALFPYISYKRINTDFDVWKRSNGVVKLTLEIAVWSDDYDESVRVAERAMDIISEQAGMSIINCTEGYDSCAYYQVITMTIE